MPRLIDPGPVGPPVAVGEAIAMLDAMGFDPRDDAAWDAAAPVLSRLSANRAALGGLAADALAGRAVPGGVGYGPQVLMLGTGERGWFLRANLWPHADDPLLRASGRAAFFYDVPHDHDFSFLTIGHHGPGYESDYWERDDDPVPRLPGDRAGLRSVGRHRVGPGTMMLYRAHRDVHDQKPPAAFSVTINVMQAGTATRWRDQYRFDPASDTIAATMNPGATDGLIALAAHCGGEAGRDLVRHAALRHPADRVRFGAVRALAGAASDAASRAAVLEAAARVGDRYVAPLARRLLGDLPAIERWASAGTDA